MITCQEVVEHLMAYINNELSVDERAAVDAHLAVCPECAIFLKNYEATILYELTAFNHPEQMIEESIPESLVQAILAARVKKKA